MSLQGDLTTLDLASLFQNLEGARKSGVLSVEDRDEKRELYFAEGRLAAIAWPGRATFLEYLVGSGAVSAEDVESARKRRKRGQTVGAALAVGGEIAVEQLAAIAGARLLDDACEILAAGAKRFEFTEREQPSDAFDREERTLGVALAASPLLLESARRSDHWTMIRERVPSDATHYQIAKRPREPADQARARFAGEVLDLLDGTRSVSEVVERFPTRRFDVYLFLAELAEKQSIRPIPAADVNQRVLELARRDRPRAIALLEHALESNPRSLALLATKASLAQKSGDVAQALEALKLVFHLQTESEDRDGARETLAKLRKLDADDPFAWERGLDLALAEGRRKDAFADARRLIELYEKPGLHRKVCAVLERLIAETGPTWELVRDLARARAEAGDRELAIRGLERHASDLVALESYPLARKAYEEILAIAPGRARAKAALEDLASGAIARRKALWRARRRNAVLAFLCFVVLPWVGYEALARREFVAATRALASTGALDTGRRAAAREGFATLRGGAYRWSTTALFDVDPVLAELDLSNEPPLR